MMKPLLIGSRVDTAFGSGVVVDRRGWRDAIADMSDSEARVFSQEIASRYGLGFKDLYQNLFVQLDVELFDGTGFVWVELKELLHEQVGKAERVGKGVKAENRRGKAGEG